MKISTVTELQQTQRGSHELQVRAQGRETLAVDLTLGMVRPVLRMISINAR
jgi:hypothetical protein